jgi:hypothetical protein
MQILALLVRYGTEKYGTAWETIQAIFSRNTGSVDLSIIVIDNATQDDCIETLAPRVTLIGGDNRAWEFSGWDKGLAFAGVDLNQYDLVNISTSAFNTLYTRYLDRFSDALLEELVGRAITCGHIDYYPQPVSLLGYCSQHWLRSSFFFIPPAELRLLGSMVSISDLDRSAIFSGNPHSPFKVQAPLSPNYQDYIVRWLTRDGTGQGTEWHSRFDLNGETLTFFENKALAILNEHLLSVRLRAQGSRLVDMTWAATITDRGKSLPHLIPPWRYQLAERDVDAFPFAKTFPDYSLFSGVEG